MLTFKKLKKVYYEREIITRTGSRYILSERKDGIFVRRISEHEISAPNGFKSEKGTKDIERRVKMILEYPVVGGHFVASVEGGVISTTTIVEIVDKVA